MLFLRHHTLSLAFAHHKLALVHFTAGVRQLTKPVELRECDTCQMCHRDIGNSSLSLSMPLFLSFLSLALSLSLSLSLPLPTSLPLFISLTLFPLPSPVASCPHRSSPSSCRASPSDHRVDSPATHQHNDSHQSN